jgi:large subunit ribosomal protein L6
MWAYGRKSRFLLFGVKKEEVYRIAKRIVELRVPDSYKGKGVRYVNQFLKLKETKDAKKK